MVDKRMHAGIFSQWEILLLVLAGFAYVMLVQHLAKKDARPRVLNEAELLAKLALMGPNNEYDIFRVSAREWHLAENRIAGDFREYLLEGLIPYYVNSYLRKFAKENGNVFQPPFMADGRGYLPWLK